MTWTIIWIVFMAGCVVAMIVAAVRQASRRKAAAVPAVPAESLDGGMEFDESPDAMHNLDDLSGLQEEPDFDFSKPAR